MEEFDVDTRDRFLRLFLEHEDSLRLFLRANLFDAEEVREVMQDVAVVLWRKFDDTMDSDSFRRWSIGVARLEVLNLRRRYSRDRHVFGDRVTELLADSIEAESEKHSAERTALNSCLEKLTRKQRLLIDTAYAPQSRIDKLAEEMGVTAMSVYKRLHRIRQQLLVCIQKRVARDLA